MGFRLHVERARRAQRLRVARAKDPGGDVAVVLRRPGGKRLWAQETLVAFVRNDPWFGPSAPWALRSDTAPKLALNPGADPVATTGARWRSHEHD